MSKFAVLIVEDDRWTARALSATLAEDDRLHILPPVASGEAALASFEESRPDVVLMDLNLGPGMNGIDAINAIISKDSTACVLVLTTVAPGPGLARALMGGAIAAINKNASDELLVQTVVSAAAGDRNSIASTLARDIIISGDLDSVPLSPVPVLTLREREILRDICAGLNYLEIAESQHIAITTVKAHARSLRDKMGASSLAQLVVRALQFHFVSTGQGLGSLQNT